MRPTVNRAAGRARPRRGAGSPPWSWPLALLAAYAGAAVVTGVAAAAGGDRHPAAALAAYALLAAGACLPASPLVVPAAAAIAWLFDDGFMIGRHAILAWPGMAGLWRLAILLAAAAAGSALGAAARAHQPPPVQQAPRPDGTPARDHASPGRPAGGRPALTLIHSTPAPEDEAAVRAPAAGRHTGS